MPNEITRQPLWGDLGREMVPLRMLMDRMLENAFMPTGSLLSGGGDSRGMMAGFGMDVDEDDDAYYISCHLPGINPEDVNITFQDGMLTISGETRRRSQEGRRSLHQEVSYGRFQRQLSLPGAIDPAKAEANYHDGVLEVKLPKSEASRPRTIQVKAGGEGKQDRSQEIPVETQQGQEAKSKRETGKSK